MVNDDVSSWLWEMLSDEDLLHFEFQFTRTSEKNPEHTFRALRLSSFFRKKKDKMKRSEENPKHSSTSLIQVSLNPEFYDRTKHMRRYYHFVNDVHVITDGHVELVRAPSAEMHADFLTKNLFQAQLNHHLTALGLISGDFPPI